MNKKRLLCIILTLTAVISMMLIRDSAAWLDTRTGDPLPQNIIANRMGFTFEGSLDSYLQNEGGNDFIITDQNLIWDNDGVIDCVNDSNMDTSVRFRIVYDMPVLNGGTRTSVQRVYAASATADHIVAGVADGWTMNADGYFYRDFSDTDSGKFDIITDIHFNENMVTKELYFTNDVAFSGNIKVEIQAKQADNVDWVDIWSTGTP